jgi:hypothetical protein
MMHILVDMIASGELHVNVRNCLNETLVQRVVVGSRNSGGAGRAKLTVEQGVQILHQLLDLGATVHVNALGKLVTQYNIWVELFWILPMLEVILSHATWAELEEWELEFAKFSLPSSETDFFADDKELHDAIHARSCLNLWSFQSEVGFRGRVVSYMIQKHRRKLIWSQLRAEWCALVHRSNICPKPPT